MSRETFRESDAYQISELMFGIVGQMDRYFAGVTAEFGLTGAQGRLLLELSAPATMKGLADRLGCDASNITGLVDRMEDHGLLRRRTDATDRRVRWIEPTPEGLATLERLQARFAADQPSVLALSRSDRAALLRLLRRVYEAEKARIASTSSRSPDTPAI